MHVAEAAHIHQDVEAKLLSGTERSQHLVMPAAMTQSQINDLAANGFARSLYSLANLSIRIVAVLVNQRSSQFHFQRLFSKQINDGACGDWQITHQLGSHLPQLTSGLEFVLVRIGVFHQRRRHSDFPQQFLFRALTQFRRSCANLLYQFPQYLLIDVVGRRGGGLLQQSS